MQVNTPHEMLVTVAKVTLPQVQVFGFESCAEPVVAIEKASICVDHGQVLISIKFSSTSIGADYYII